MSILGVAGLVYGVGELDLCRRFFEDFGLELETRDDDRALFRLREDSTVELRRADDASLPAPCLIAGGPREVIWGVDAPETLDAIARELTRDREVVLDAAGVLHARDDAGLNIGFRVWTRRPLQAEQPPAENSTSHVARWNRNRRWYPRARPALINHVVFGVPDVDQAAAFYADRLGFRLTDVMRGVGNFLRCDGRPEHHNLFFRRRRSLRFEHVSFGVENIDELMVGANEMRRRGWVSREGLGRHRMGSLLFYYIDSPAGGQAEYTADGDYVTDDWKPRVWDPAFGNHYWLAEPGERAVIDHSGSAIEIGGWAAAPEPAREAAR